MSIVCGGVEWLLLPRPKHIKYSLLCEFLLCLQIFFSSSCGWLCCGWPFLNVFFLSFFFFIIFFISLTEPFLKVEHFKPFYLYALYNMTLYGGTSQIKIAESSINLMIYQDKIRNSKHLRCASILVHTIFFTTQELYENLKKKRRCLL